MKLELLEATDRHFRNVRLDAVLVIANQHILETNFRMFEGLFRKGLKPSNTFLIGKSYSTNPSILKKFQKRGVFVSPYSTGFDSKTAYDKYFDRACKEFLKNIFKNINTSDFSKIIIIDDGGYLISNLGRFAKHTSSFIGIEQTSSGYNRLKKEKVAFPVINVARSNAKLIYESPYVAQAIVEEIHRRLKRLKLKPHKALVIGAWHVGREVFTLLKNSFETHIYDVKTKLSDFGKVSLNSILPEFDLIVGVTGTPVITKFNTLKKGTVLVSGSSSDREFSASDLRKLLPPSKKPHADLRINGIYLLNGGFPVNFIGKPHSVQPEKIQLTRSLIFGSICLATTKKYPKVFINVDRSLQEMLVEKFQKLNQA